ncbi:CehA/McbA family metallohydrolase [Paludibaculum fermentans]|uniref:CehA/McbA family metallohydrolase n=1 Tax=Paludibaculum fermentans TaxID=1473598 RepID=UPI003EC070A0
MPTDRRRVLQWIASAALPALARETGTLHVRVISDDAGARLPCSIALLDSAGVLAVENRSYLDGFRCDGEFRRTLPAGSAKLTVTRGFDFIGETRDLTIRPGATTELTIRLRRRSPLFGLGWRCGDHHIHMTHGESRIRVDFDYIALAARAEGLEQLSVGQAWNIPKPTATAAERECRRVSTPDCTLSWNLEAPKNYYRGDASRTLGHCWFIGARASDTIAEELLALSAHDYESAKEPTANFESHALIHAHGGVVAYTHPCRWWWGQWGGQGGYPVEERKFISNLAAELPFDTLAGPTYDALDILMQTHEKEVNANGQKLWFLLLNHGYRIPATASSDSTFDNENRGTPGKVRVYTHMDGQPSIAAAADAIRRGRSFVTSGPLLLLEVDGQGPGSTLTAAAAQRRVARLRAWPSGLPGERLTGVELLRNGEVMRTFTPAEGDGGFEVEHSWTEEGGAWIIARCFGRNRDTQVAITNPVFLDRSPWTPALPARARVRVRIHDYNSGARVGALCEIVEMVGRTPRLLFGREAREGAVDLEVPATARVRVTAPGYRPMTRSLFLDVPEILRSTLETRVEQMLDWSTYERTRRLLSEAQLDFPLVRG